MVESRAKARDPESTAQDIVDVNKTASEAEAQMAEINFQNIDLENAAAVATATRALGPWTRN